MRLLLRLTCEVSFAALVLYPMLMRIADPLLTCLYATMQSEDFQHRLAEGRPQAMQLQELPVLEVVSIISIAGGWLCLELNEYGPSALHLIVFMQPGVLGLWKPCYGVS
jgi:hypothetical protein